MKLHCDSAISSTFLHSFSAISYTKGGVSYTTRAFSFLFHSSSLILHCPIHNGHAHGIGHSEQATIKFFEILWCYSRFALSLQSLILMMR